MTEQTKLEQLAAPTREDELEWRIGQSGVDRNGKPWAKILAYVTNRAVQQRLDDSFGPAFWQNEFRESGDGYLCGLSILIDSVWITKFDGASCTQVEPLKGGLSDSMKRAAVQWGVGRDLYARGETWAETSTDRQNGEGWHYAKAKQQSGPDVTFYWRAPVSGRTAPAPAPSTPPPASQPPVDQAALAVAARKMFSSACDAVPFDSYAAELVALERIRAGTGHPLLAMEQITAGQWKAAANNLVAIRAAVEGTGPEGN